MRSGRAKGRVLRSSLSYFLVPDGTLLAGIGCNVAPETICGRVCRLVAPFSDRGDDRRGCSGRFRSVDRRRIEPACSGPPRGPHKGASGTRCHPFRYVRIRPSRRDQPHLPAVTLSVRKMKEWSSSYRCSPKGSNTEMSFVIRSSSFTRGPSFTSFNSQPLDRAEAYSPTRLPSPELSM